MSWMLALYFVFANPYVVISTVCKVLRVWVIALNVSFRVRNCSSYSLVMEYSFEEYLISQRSITWPLRSINKSIWVPL